VKVEKNYIFTTPEGDASLADLFGKHSQLFIKHFMMGPEQDWQCPGCTLEVAHVDGLLEYFEHHDMSYVAVARAGGEQFLGIYGFFDLLPKGREEYGPTHSLPDWASFKTRDIHNMQGRSNGGKEIPECGCAKD
jgi:predicted dithiol-disulfide oxidoreductase (DUF899 family)